MKTNKEILIVGAGSAGLSSALFLAEAGYKPRIIDKRLQRHEVSKALGVNPNSLKLFEHTPVTKKFLDNGWKMECMNMWSKGKLVYKNDFRHIKHDYPFILIQPQFETENILEEELNSRGIFVERGLELDTIVSSGKLNTVKLKDNSEIICHTVLGADGNKSAVRQAMGIEFQGWQRNEELHLFDIELETSLSPTEGHWLYSKEGCMLMLHIKDGVWRVGGSLKNPLNYVPKGTRFGKVKWETKFTIRENMAVQYQKENVFLLGDAAHIHSPVGGKGMNLCMEDAYTFANLYKDGREQEFEKIRKPRIEYNIRRIGKITKRLSAHSFFANNVRKHIGKFRFLFPLIMPKMRKFLLGLK